GRHRASRAAGSPGPTINLLAVGAVSPRKGYDVLIAALADLREQDWRLTLVGATDRAPAASAELKAGIDRAGLGDRISL
ncbi:glycosyltransferase, partial [Klebsiella michiganensis]|uniref:glycosyltransferase n=1 Tax=Klebsiella michiganensis TaxID=1134687 RepID=UPI0013D0272D